jgi:hypothetical protein
MAEFHIKASEATRTMRNHTSSTCSIKWLLLTLISEDYG